MKPDVLFRLFSITLLLFVLLAVATPTLAFQSSTGLFRDAAKTPAFDHAREQAVVRTRYVDVNLDLLPGARGSAPAGSPVLLNLFDNRSFTAVLNHVERKPNGLIWVGSLQGIELSSVNLVAEGNIFVGSINYPGGMYAIRYAGNGVQAIQEIDQSKYPRERAAIPAAPLAPDSYTPQPGVAPDAGTSIDVMVIYTPAFAAYAGGTAAADAAVDLAISQTNTSYENSGITQRVNLVYRGQVPYTEPGTGTDANWETALYDLTDGTGGMGGVAVLRNTYGADVVSLFTRWPSPAYCGLGWYMDQVAPSFASSAFSVVDGECATTAFSLAHEMGHNMGAHHDWYPFTSAPSTPYTYAHGRVNLTGKWRTIMAYDSLCVNQTPWFNCNRILFWSNPGLTYGGAPLGVAGGTKSDSTCYNNLTNPSCDADNHLVLNSTAYTVANFRQHFSSPAIDLYLPLLQKTEVVAPGISGKLNQGGVPAAGVALELRFTADGTHYSPAGSTTTDASGNYRFTGVPALGGGSQSYYVRYLNEAMTPGRVYSWSSRDITSYSAGAGVNLGTGDLADILLVSPADPATVALPHSFYWTPRPATPTDSYFVSIYNPITGNPYGTTPLLGYTDHADIAAVPPTMYSVGVPYAWDVTAFDLNGGFANSLDLHTITLTSLGSDAASALDIRAPLTPPRLDRRRPDLKR